MIGESAAFLAMQEQVSALAPLDRPVVIAGERGTGKELVAARLHYLSRRWEGPFVTVNCAALSETLLDAELFGHEAGAFTGATRRRQGRFEAADGGTLFLDEIATASARVQEKLLRAIEYGEFERVGSSATRRVDVRVICATNADLPAMAADGSFRADLLDRLAFAVVVMPPLRDRLDDVDSLAEHFALAMTAELGRSFFPGFTERARAALRAYSWPGNVRELRNVVERAVALAEPGEVVDAIVTDPFARPFPARSSPAAEAPRPVPDSPAEGGFEARVAAYEAALLRDALEAARFNQRAAAERLDLTYHKFRHLARKHGLIGPVGRSDGDDGCTNVAAQE